MNVHGGTITYEATYAVPAPTTTRGVSTKLGASADGKQISYGSGRCAILRSLDAGGPTLSLGHAAPVTVAKIISPYYTASGDASGALKVWDTTGNYSLKFEAKPISRINDIAFDGEGKRLVVVGEGRSSWGATFSLDTGSSIGEVAGHSKCINGVAMRPQRPFRAVTGSDDFSVVLMNGVPFKFTSQSRRHRRFVQSMDYAPDGKLFLSAGSDGRVFLYDGTTGEDKGELVDGDTAHASGVYAGAFSRDSRQIATSAADAQVKLWDVETSKVVKTWDFASSENSLQQQQVGNVWAGSSIVSLSFSGNLNILDPRSDTPVSTLYGHQNPTTAVIADPISSSSTFFSGDSTGRVLRVEASGQTEPLENTHSGLVVDFVEDGKGAIYSTGYDDTIKTLSGGKTFDSKTIATAGQPKGLAVSTSDGTLYVATASEVQVIVGGSKKSFVPASSTCIAASSDGSYVAVGTEQSTVLLFDSKDKSSLRILATIELRASASSLAFSTDSTHLAVGLSTGKIPFYEVSTPKLVHSRWADSTARIHSLAFNTSGTHLAAASLDESIRVYSIKSPSIVLASKNAHRGGVSTVVWTGDEGLVSAGADGAVKKWVIKFA
ncbi:BQ2448_5250 [Microbotryum intermedium]|uniref:BQ2448_5250 protein n=1 Tax=Microbotryum intermedium TaxID=269621 RepID=A0A238F4J6_9BASI|nr:BQ2448_5250 [Microbotryum intermedium]